MREADHYERAEGRRVTCRLCPHGCELGAAAVSLAGGAGEGGSFAFAEGVGICGVRRNQDGVLYAEAHEEVARLDPCAVEALPLYHFRPGTRALAVGSAGTPFPAELSPPGLAPPAPDATRFAAAHEVIDVAVGQELSAIAYAGGEPFIWFEQLREIAERARAEGLANLLLTNAFVSEAPAREIAPLVDAANVALFGPDRVYRGRAKASLDPVLATVDILRAAGVHLEATFVVLAGANDDPASLDGVATLVLERLGGAPLHVASPLAMETAAPVRVMQRVAETLGRLLPHVYLSPIYAGTAPNTACRACGAILIERPARGPARASGVAPGGACGRCGARSEIRLTPA